MARSTRPGSSGASGSCYHRIIGNILIAVGALLPAFGGAFSRLGIPGALYISELLGAVLMFIGFIRATTPAKGPEGWRGV